VKAQFAARRIGDRPQSPLSSLGSTGRSSIPETAVIELISRGVLDHPLSRVMTNKSVARISQKRFS